MPPYDGKGPRINTDEMKAQMYPAGKHRYHFGSNRDMSNLQGHGLNGRCMYVYCEKCLAVECPNCHGSGNVVLFHSVSREMAMDAGAPEMEGQPVPEVVTCYLCGGDARVTAAQRDEYIAHGPEW